MQGETLSSADSRVFLTVQADGNLVLYNRQAYDLYGATQAAAIWATGTWGAAPSPFALIMQPVRESHTAGAPELLRRRRCRISMQHACAIHPLAEHPLRVHQLTCRTATWSYTVEAPSLTAPCSRPTHSTGASTPAGWWFPAPAAAALQCWTPRTA